MVRRIIVQGKLTREERFIETCRNCNTLFSFEESDTVETWPNGLSHSPALIVFCPLCGTENATEFQFAEG